MLLLVPWDNSFSFIMLGWPRYLISLTRVYFKGTADRLYLGNRKRCLRGRKQAVTPMRSLLTRCNKDNINVSNEQLYMESWQLEGIYVPCSLLYPQCLDQWLVYISHLLNICWIHDECHFAFCSFQKYIWPTYTHSSTWQLFNTWSQMLHLL